LFLDSVTLVGQPELAHIGAQLAVLGCREACRRKLEFLPQQTERDRRGLAGNVQPIGRLDVPFPSRQGIALQLLGAGEFAERLFRLLDYLFCLLDIAVTRRSMGAVHKTKMSRLRLCASGCHIAYSRKLIWLCERF